MEQMDFLVCARCFTYNHAPYIEDAMNGFCMQQTHFPYVCVIVDDASTDGESEVIKNYLQTHFDLDNKAVVRNEGTDDYVLTFAQHKDNKNCFFAVYYLKYNHYSIKKNKFPYFTEFYDGVKYHALCEGDDYWINPQKLQMQVDFLDTHEDVGICYTNFNILYDDCQKQKIALFTSEPHKYPKYYDSPEEFIYRAGYVCPPSWMIRKTTLQKESNDIVDSLDGSFVSFAYYMATSKVYCVDEVTTVYRVISESASHSTSPEKLYRRARNLLETKIELINKLDLDRNYVDLCKKKYYKDHLFFFIVNDKKNEMDELLKELNEFTAIEKKIIQISKSKYGIRFIKWCYYFAKNHNFQRASYHFANK